MAIKLQAGGFTNRLRRLLHKAQAAIKSERGDCTKKALAEWIGLKPCAIYRFMREPDAGISSATVDRMAHFFGIEVPMEYRQARPLRKRRVRRAA